MNKRIKAVLLSLVMVVGLLATAVPASAAGETSFNVTADKTTANPGDTITYAVELGSVTNMGGVAFELEIPAGCDVLLECMSNLVANEMFEPGAAGLHTVNAVLNGVNHLREEAANLIIVTNEIFSDGIAYSSQTRIYQEYLGAINQEIAHMADKVTEVVYGIPIPVKEYGKEGQQNS